MGKPRDTKIAILPSTTRKGTTLSTSAALDSPSVISKLVSPPQASNAGTSAESENSSHNCDDASAVLDNDGSLGSFLDATIARSRQIENTETPNENAATPVNSPESIEYSSDDLDEDYVELDDDFIEKCNATTDARKIKKLLAEHAVRYKLSPDPKFATSPINIRDKDYDFSLDLSHIAIVEKTPFCGTEKESAVEHMTELSTLSDNDKDDIPDKEEIEKEPEKPTKNKKYTKEDFIAEKHGAVIDCNKGMVTFNVDDKEHTVYFPKRIDKKGKMKKFKFGELFKKGTTSTGILDDFFTLVNRAGLATYVGDEREQYYRLTKIFVESFKFHNTQYEPTVAFKIYDNPVTMELEEFCRALDIAPVGTARRIDDNPRDLLELYRGITEDDCRTIQRGKIRNIQLPAIKYFAYYIATSILGRENTSNISSYHLAFLNAALTGQTPYHLGSLIARRLSSRGPIFGGTIALRILTHLRLPLDSNDVPLTPRRLDIAAMKSHHFVTTDSTIDNMVYRMLFADGNEKEIPLPQPGLFNIDRQSWSLTKEEVEEHMKIQEFHQQHDSENAEPSYDCTVTYPDVSSSTYLEPGRSSSYYGDTTSWGPWE
ncbi:hypothetical protein QYE76_065766 [Lolium multiflorum]|uniref:Arabidopsis retrotransposon Orf1 C-terminal domain-containing protein n=1 Tax=Lolium multiflorum TaxID=4521 RepID=A0AAD8S950_LOLMU|nr:hypothetical protein QYE76_065766 [Lolium multiflorum]